jgi:aryl-alcohol dehydrogenase-like predicted oxidoreductase
VRFAPLGSSGLTISRLGIGGWQAGGSGPWGAGPRADDEQAIQAIRRAVEGGVNWVDTAASYGLGHSEEVVRRALEPWRIGEEVHVFTKCGHPWEPPDRIWTELSPASIRRECEGSLRRLGVERIDLYQFHHTDPRTPIEESWAAMTDLLNEGKVGWIGTSNLDVALLDRCEAVRHVDSIQPELSLLRPDARRDVIPWARRHDTGVLVYSPLASGCLSGTYDRDRLDALPEDDWRRLDADRILAFIDGLTTIADGTKRSLVRLAIAWTLSVDGVTGAICGARNADQVEDWIEASDDVLPAGTIATIERSGERLGFL